MPEGGKAVRRKFNIGVQLTGGFLCEGKDDLGIKIFNELKNESITLVQSWKRFFCKSINNADYCILYTYSEGNGRLRD